MEVHHADCNHANNADANLCPACVLCHPVNHIGELAARFSRPDQAEVAGGHVQLSYLPDISQADLSHLLRTIGHVMNVGSEEQRGEAAALYEQLCSYTNYVETAWGSSRAAYFAVALREVDKEVFDARPKSMAGIRVVFSFDTVKKLASRFINEFVPLPLLAWTSIFEQRMARR
jgi:hypothetical protein